MTMPGEVSQMKQRLVYRGIQKWMTGALMFQDEAKAGASRHPDVRRMVQMVCRCDKEFCMEVTSHNEVRFT